MKKTIKRHTNLRNLYSVILVVVVAIMAFGFAGCSEQQINNSVSTTPVVNNTSQVTTTRIVQAELAKYYKSASELFADSDIVVFGVFENKERIVPDNTSSKPYFPGWRELAFRVTEAVKGNSNQEVWVAQHVTFNSDGSVGGPYAEDALLSPGGQYVLFLKQNTGTCYWLTGATQGAFPIIDNKVYSRNIIGGIPEGIGPTVNGISLEQFLQSIKK